MIAGSLGCGDSGVVSTVIQGASGSACEDRLHLGRVAGLVQAQRAPGARQRPQPEQVSLPARSCAACASRALVSSHRLGGGARRDGQR